MTFNEYQAYAQRTSNTKDLNAKVLNGVMGLNGEAGECIDIIKKWKFQGHDLDLYDFIQELGDVLWYVAECATGIGVKLDEIAAHNIDKLRARYPNGFTVDNSVHRVDN